MRIPGNIPTPVFVAAILFLVLFFGGYAMGSTQAVTTQRISVFDPSGSNGANVNALGHLSVHVADGSLPAYTGPIYSRHMSYPLRSLTSGTCYAAFTRGGGSFLSASVLDKRGSGHGLPQILVRVDANPVWVEDGHANSSPIMAAAGVSRAGSVYTFAYSYSLSFKAFAGILLCWHGQGESDKFAVQMTLANGGGGPYLPEEYTFRRSGSRFTFVKLVGTSPTPESYQILQSTSTIVSGEHKITDPIPPVTLPPNPTPQQQAKPQKYTVTAAAKPTGPLFYIFENFGGSNVSPTRIGPFGNWSQE